MDCHHSIEDLGIVMGMALHQALEDKAGIRRYGSFYVPMDEALGFCALDVSGRAFLVFDTEYANPSVGTLDCCMVKEFFRALAFQAGLTLHLKTLYGENNHPIKSKLCLRLLPCLKRGSNQNRGRCTLSKGVL